MPKNGKQYLGVSGAARALRISESAVRDLERRGILPAERIATGQRIFKAEDVDRVSRERLARQAERAS